MRKAPAVILLLAFLAPTAHPQQPKLLHTLGEGHSHAVLCVAFSPDGKTLASSSMDSTIRLWDVSTGRTVATLTGHSKPVKSVAFSVDGATLASASSDGTVKLWDVATGKNTDTLTGHEKEVWSVAFHPSGKGLYSGGLDGTIRVWSPTSGLRIGALKGYLGPVSALAFSPDGRTLFSGGANFKDAVWDFRSARPFTQIHAWAPSTGTWSVACRPDGELVAVGTNKGTVMLFDPVTREEKKPLSGHAGHVFSVAFSPDSKLLASASAVFDPTGNTSGPGDVKLWDARTGKAQTSIDFPCAVWSVAFSPDGKLLAIGGPENTIQLMDVKDRKVTRLMRGLNTVGGVAFSRDGKTLFTASLPQGTVDLWDATTGQATVSFRGHSGGVGPLALSPDGKLLASGSSDTTVRLWDAATGKPVAVLRGHTKPVQTLAFSPDGKTLASGAGDVIPTLIVPSRGDIKLWDVATGKNTATITGQRDQIIAVAFRPDGKVLASGGQYGSVFLWDVTTGIKIRDLGTKGVKARALAFSPDGHTLAVPSAFGVRLWDFRVNRFTTTFMVGQPDAIAFSPNGATLAVGGTGWVALCDAKATSDKPVMADRKMPAGLVYAMAFSPDGSVLAVGSSNTPPELPFGAGRVYLWSVPKKQLP